MITSVKTKSWNERSECGNNIYNPLQEDQEETQDYTLVSFLYEDFLISSEAPSGQAGTICKR